MVTSGSAGGGTRREGHGTRRSSPPPRHDDRRPRHRRRPRRGAPLAPTEGSRNITCPHCKNTFQRVNQNIPGLGGPV